MTLTSTKPNENEPQTRGQEVIFYTNNNDEDVEANNLDDKSNVGSPDAPANTNNVKRGYFNVTAKTVACGFAFLMAVGAIGIAAGVGIAGATESATQVNLQSATPEIDWDDDWTPGAGKSGKGQFDFVECIIEPIIALKSGPPEGDLSMKKFEKTLWKPYIKKCEDFWSYIAYFFTVGGFGTFVGERVDQALQVQANAVTVNDNDNNVAMMMTELSDSTGCSAIMEAVGDEMPIVYLASLSDEARVKLLENVQECLRTITSDAIFGDEVQAALQLD